MNTQTYNEKFYFADPNEEEEEDGGGATIPDEAP